MMGDLSDTIIDGDPFDVHEGGEDGGGFDPTSLSLSTQTPVAADEIITGESGGTWVRKTLAKMKEYFATLFTGATDLTDGTQGELPTPLAGQQNATIMGSGVWSTLLYDTLSKYENLSNGLGQAYTGDLDDIDVSSCYNCSGEGGVSHAPEAHWGFLSTYIHCYSTAYRSQIWVTMPNGSYNPKIYVRSRTGTTWTAWKRFLSESDVINNLTSTSTTAPLSAAQGKALNDKISNIGKVIQGSASFSAPSSRQNYNLTLSKSLLANHFYLLFLSVHVQWWQTGGSGASCMLCIGTHITQTHDASATTPDGTTVTDIGCYTPSSDVKSIPYEIWQGSGSNKNLMVLFTAIQLT